MRSAGALMVVLGGLALTISGVVAAVTTRNMTACIPVIVTGALMVATRGNE